jgi:transforming growth factor-beta-induced protein
MRESFRRTAALAAVAALTLAACGDDAADEGATTTAPAAGEATAEPTAEAPADTTAADTTAAAGDTTAAAADGGTIVDVAVGAGTFTTLVAAVQAAGLVETLSSPGPYTVFAPTDEAFAAALTSLGLTADELLADTATLTSILTYHVVEGEVPSSQVVTLNGQDVATVNGATVKVTVEGDTVKVNDATVTAVDVEASNGVIHVIDSVLLPPEG